jgi:hypothetical protein
MPVISTVETAHGSLYDLGVAGGASTAWPAANRAYYSPIWIDETYVPTYAFVVNAATISGNFDVGIYDAGFTRLWSSGSTALSGANTNQTVAVSGLTMSPGLYYLAMSVNNTTYTHLALTSSFGNQWRRLSGVMMQETAFPLPATGTPVAVDTANIGVFAGLSNRSFF